MADKGRTRITRRAFVATSGLGAAAAAALGGAALDAQNATDRPGGPPPPADAANVPAAIKALKPMTAGVVPISDGERRARVDKARRLMRDNGIGAILLEGGSSMYYFTGVSWSLSERPFVAVIPAQGEPAWVCPGFEEARARELVKAPNADVRVWQEDESPSDRIAGILRDRGIATGKLGVEERVELVSAVPVTAGCRMIKSPADDGCSLEGYQSDVTRTVVFGKPTPHQREVWELEHRAQAAAFAAVKPGVPCEAIDAAARKVITDAGYGPGYKVPGLPHRTGHGIGLDGHEWTYLVKGNTTPLAPGMCFSDEPMITNYAEFGVRLEDCFHVTGTGAEFFTPPSPSLDDPFGNVHFGAK